MDCEQLRGVRAPLKQSYRNDPASALVTLRAEGELDGEQIACRVSTGLHQPLAAPVTKWKVVPPSISIGSRA
jgi:hypothetical protein